MEKLVRAIVVMAVLLDVEVAVLVDVVVVKLVVEVEQKILKGR